MAGEVVIKTRLGTEGLKDAIKDVVNQLKDIEEEENVINDQRLSLELDLEEAKNGLELTKKLIQEVEDQLKEMEQTKPMKELNSDEEYLSLIDKQTELNDKSKEYENSLKKIDSLILDNDKQMVKLIKSENSANAELSQLTSFGAKFKAFLNDTKKSIGGFLSKIPSIIGRVLSSIKTIGLVIGGLGISGIVSLIGLAAAKSEKSKEQLEQIANLITNIANQLIQALLPIAEKIVDWIYKAIGYLGIILKEWFGIDISSGNTSDNLDKSVKSAKALRKQLMGFDEMNVLNDSGGTGIAGIGDKDVEANLKFNYPDDQEFIDWAKRLKHNWDVTWGEESDWVNENPEEFEVTTPMALTDKLFVISKPKLQKKFEEYKSLLQEMTTEWERSYENGIFTFIDPVTQKAVKLTYKEMGALNDLLSSGEAHMWHEEMLNTVDDQLDRIKDARIENEEWLGKQVKDFAGTSWVQAMFGDKKENKNDSTDVEKVVKDFIFNASKERQDAIEKFKKNPWFQAMFGNNEELQQAAEEGVRTVGGMTGEIFEAIRKGSYKVKDGFVEIKLASGQTVKYSTDEFKKLKEAVDLTGEAGKTSADKTKTSWNATGTSIGTTATNVGRAGIEAFDSLSDSAEENASETSTLWQRAYNLITQTGQTEGQKQKQNSSKNTKGIIDDTKTQIDNYNKNPKTANIQTQQDPKHNAKTTTNEINQDVDNANKNPPKAKVEVQNPSKNSLQKLHDKIAEWLKFNLVLQGASGAVGGALGTVKASAKGSVISYPKLSSGGIINRPGRGVMLANGGAIGGERGREAVIPLTDSGQMELLGQAIARNIIVNLTNEVKLDGKQLARYTSKAMSDMQFTSNGGVI